LKGVIAKRIAYAEMKAGVSSGSILTFDESGYHALYNLTQGSVGLALDVMRIILQTVGEQLTTSPPYVVNRARIEELGLTFEYLEKNYDDPLKDAELIRVRPWWEID